MINIIELQKKLDELQEQLDKETKRRCDAEYFLEDAFGWFFCEKCEHFVQNEDMINCAVCGWFCEKHENFKRCEKCDNMDFCQRTFECTFRNVNGKLLCPNCY